MVNVHSDTIGGPGELWEPTENPQKKGSLIFFLPLFPLLSTRAATFSVSCCCQRFKCLSNALLCVNFIGFFFRCFVLRWDVEKKSFAFQSFKKGTKHTHKRMSTFEDWWMMAGPMTKFAMSAAVVTSVVVWTLSDYSESLQVDLYATIANLQLWRLFTGTYYFGEFTFGWFYAVAKLVVFTKFNEDFDFSGRLADMVWMKLLLITMIHMMASLVGVTMVGPSLTTALSVIFARRHPDYRLHIYIFTFTGMYFPLFPLVADLIAWRGILPFVIGVSAAYIFLFLVDDLPKRYNKHWGKTPQFLLATFPNRVVPPRQLAAQVAQRRMGSGRVLGTA